MERSLPSNTLDYDDEYTPSGNWCSQSFNENQLESFFPENHPPPPYYNKTYHNLDSVSLDSSISKSMVNSLNSYSNRNLEDGSSCNYNDNPFTNSQSNSLKDILFSNSLSSSNFDDGPFSNSHNTLKDVQFSNSQSNLKDISFSKSQSIRNLKDVPIFNSSSNSNLKNDPFSVRCRIPVPDSMSDYHLWLETSFMCRRNERERQRVRSVNDGFSRLRNHLPRGVQMRRRQSKVETLRNAITYIKRLQKLVNEKAQEDNGNKV